MTIHATTHMLQKITRKTTNKTRIKGISPVLGQNNNNKENKRKRLRSCFLRKKKKNKKEKEKKRHQSFEIDLERIIDYDNYENLYPMTGIDIVFVPLCNTNINFQNGQMDSMCF